MRQRKTLLVLVALAALAALAVVPVMVLAQENDQPASPVAGLRQIFLEKLARALGVSQEELQQAAGKAARETIQEGVDKGYLTQQQADRLQERAREMPWALLGQAGGWHRGGRFNQAGDLAQALGLTPQELMQQLRQGKTLDQLLAEKGLTKEQLKERLVEQARARLDQAVQQGRLTREQADQMLEKLQQLDPAKMFELKTGKPGGRFMHRRGGGAPAAQPQPQGV